MAKKQIYKFRGVGLDRNDSRKAKRRFDSYRKNYSIDSYSDLALLEELVYLEIRQEKAKELIAQYEEGNYKSKPKHALKEVDEYLEQIINLKEKLGLFKEQEQTDPYKKYIEDVERKFQQHKKENAGDYSIPCAFCGEMLILQFKVKDYEAKKHPFYKGKFLTNDYLWKCYKANKLTKEDMAKILQTSKDYISWLEKHFYNNPTDKD